MTASKQAKDLGLKSLKQVTDITGKGKGTLINWHKDEPGLFLAVILGCASLQKIEVKEVFIEVEKPKSVKTPVKRFIPPTIQDVLDHMITKGQNNLPMAENFFNYYESNGWKVGRNKMKNWKAAATKWVGSNYNTPQQSNAIKQSSASNWHERNLGL